MTTFRDLVGQNPIKPMIAYGSCFSSSTPSSSSEPSNNDPAPAAPAKTYDSLADAAADGQHGQAVNITGKGSQMVSFADKSYDDKMANVSANVSNPGSSTPSNSNSDSGNTARMNLANDLTPGNDTVYVNGQLQNTDGSAVTENTGWQNATNLATPGDGKTYVDGQLTSTNAAVVPEQYTHPTDNDNTGGTYLASQNPTVDTATTTTTNTSTTDVIEDDDDDIDDLKEILETFTTVYVDSGNGGGGGGGGGNNTSLPDDYLTEEDLATYLENIDRSSNAYDPAAFLNAYGFALEANEELIGSTISEDGLYMRRAVRDKITGEIRYVNVPIGAGAIHGNNGASQFRMERRNGFGTMV